MFCIAWDPWVHFLKEGSKLCSIFFPSAPSTVGLGVCLGRASRPHRAASGQPPFQRGWEFPSAAPPRPGSFPPTLSWSCPQGPNRHRHPNHRWPNLTVANRTRRMGGDGHGQRKSHMLANPREWILVASFPGAGKTPVIHGHKVWSGERLGFPKQQFYLVFFFHVAGPNTLCWISIGQPRGLLGRHCLGAEEQSSSYTAFEWDTVLRCAVLSLCVMVQWNIGT